MTRNNKHVLRQHWRRTLYSVVSLLLWTVPIAQLEAEPLAEDDEEALLDFYGDEDTISIATGVRQSIAQAPAVASVITAKDIQAMGATDIDEVLETVPGLHVSARAFGYGSVYVFRGVRAEYNPQVLMLINGIPVSNLFNGDRNLIWGGMPVNAVARIEVIRGPGSAVYGADAFAGVINIITKSRQDIPTTVVGARTGSFDTHDAWLLHGADWGETDFAFMLEYHRTRGHGEKIDADAQSGLDAGTGTLASYAPGQVNLQRENVDMRLELSRDFWRLRAGLQRRRDFGNGAGVADALDPNNRYQSDRWNIDLTYHNPSFRRDWDLTAQISYLDTTQEVDEDLVIFPPGTDLSIIGLGVFTDGMIGNPEVYERHSRANFYALYNGFKRHQLRVGAGYYYGDLYKTQESKNFGIDPETGAPLVPGSKIVDVSDTPYIFLPETDRKNHYLFVQDVWKLAADWELTAGLRYDKYSDFGSTTNPRLALVWSTRRDLTTKLLYGRAFRSPSMTESYAINNPVALGNPDLDPETMESLELAFNYQPTEQWRLGLNLFHYHWDDIIHFIPDPEPQTTKTAQNSGRQSGKGGEIEVSWRPSAQLSINVNYALQHSKDTSTDLDASDVPQQQVYLAVNWSVKPQWHLNGQLHWVQDRERAPNDNRTAVADYRLANLTLRRYRQGDPWQIAFALRNLFDSDIREPSAWAAPAAGIPGDLPMAGRHFFGEVQYHF